MKAAVVASFEAPPIYTDFEAPIAAEGEQLVTVTAAGLHQIVKSIANGSHYMSQGKFPFVSGVDGVGTLADGSRVYFGGARFPYGTMCEQTVIGGAMVVPLPDGVSDAFAAGIANPGMSSWAALDRAGFTAGQTVLILGATGTAGQLAVQIAKARGARHVIATGRDPEALEKLQSLGADTVISLTQSPEALLAVYGEAFSKYGTDVVLDYLWGNAAEVALAAITQRGALKAGTRIRFVQIGSLAGRTIALDSQALRSANLELLGSGFGSASLEVIRKAITDFFALAATHTFDFTFKAAPLSDVTALWNEKERATRIVFQP